MNSDVLLCFILKDSCHFLPHFICCVSDLPSLGSIMIKIYKENHSKKKKEKAVTTELGWVEIPTLVLESGSVHEKW